MTRTVTAGALRDAIAAQRPDAEIRCDMTGGGVATLYVGPADANGRCAVAIGPGRYDWSDPDLSLFWLGDTAVGPDDDGDATPAYPATLRGIADAAVATLDGATLAGIVAAERAALAARGLGLADDGSVYVLNATAER